MEVLRKFRPVAILLIGMASASSAHGPEPQPNEYQVKAAFLFNFLKFVEWPPPAGDRPWTIGVVGHRDFADLLSDLVRGKTVNGQPVVVKRIAGLADSRGCHIVYSPDAASGSQLPGVLTVGEGGMVNFYLDQDQIRFEIRPEAAKAAGLRLSAQLLHLARIR